MSTELRLALAMRGGVSLAVWIGGAVAEIDLIRRARPTGEGGAAGGPDFWSQVLGQATGYDRVVVDILAGASAGGLNGALYAASQVYDFRYDAMRDIWLTVGGTEGLVRRDGPWPSLFQGDGYFLATVQKKLDELTRDAAPPEPDAPARTRVELALSATLMEPVARAMPSPEGEPLVERRYASGFRFRQPEEPWLPTDFAPPGDPELGDTLWRLAIAARSTSSYPGAFEAAAVRSTRRDTFGAPPPPATPGPDVDLDGMFLDRSSDARPFVVADGGILDNIPIQSALDFIAHAPAAGPTQRYLLYLQPGASTTPRPAATTPTMGVDERRSTLGVVRGVLAARVAGETINADIAAIEAYNEAVERAATLRHATFNDLADPGAFLDAAAQARSSYRFNRASYEARQVFILLGDPVGTLGEDQFPKRIGGADVPDGCWRSPVADWPQADREGFETGLTRLLEGMLAAPAGPGGSALTATGDVGPLLRVTDLLIEWARWVERMPIDPTDPSQDPDLTEKAGDVKGALYRVRAFLGSVLDRSRRLAWVAAAARAQVPAQGAARAQVPAQGAARAQDRPASFVAKAVPALGRLTRVDAVVAAATVDALRGGVRGPLEIACRQALARIDGVVSEVVGTAVPSPHSADDDTELLAGIVELLVETVEPLIGAPVDRTPHGEACTPGQLLHRVLGGHPITHEVLDALDILCLQEFVAGRPGRRGVDFRRLSTANRTPLAQRFTALLDAAQATGLWWDPAVGRDEQEGIHVTLKLAGNELANFSAFLLSHWRANDWLWGRLDAIPTMVDLLVRPGPLAARLVRYTTDEEALEAVHALVVAPPGDPLRPSLEALVWAPARDAIASEVGAARRAAEDDRDQLVITAIRTALICRRQWEILREERALSTDPMGKVPMPDTRDIVEWARDYAVGAETLQGNAHAPELLDRFDEIANAATEMALWNAKLSTSRLPPIPPTVATLVRRVGPKLGRSMATRLVVVKSGGRSSRVKTLAALAVAALVVLAILGWFIDKTAFLLGLAVALLPLGVLVIVLYRSVVKLLKKETAAGP